MRIDILEIDYSSKSPGSVYFKYQIESNCKSPRIDYIWKPLDIENWEFMKPYIKDALSCFDDVEIRDMREVFEEERYYQND